MSLSPFEYIKAINEKTEVPHLRDYNPYITNIALSHSIDTIMLANEMNRLPSLPSESQFDFLNGSVRRAKRYGKWHKPQPIPHLEAVMKYYGYSKQKAIEALKVLTQDNIRDILREQDPGGRG
jgi:hypothetical protein